MSWHIGIHGEIDDYDDTGPEPDDQPAHNTNTPSTRGDEDE